MSQKNVDAIGRLFKAVEELDLAGVLAAYDPEIVTREAESLPYGGVYHGLEGARQHARGYVQAWGEFQPSVEKATDPLFLDAGEYTVVLWRQRGSAGDGRRLDLPAVSVYKMRDGKIVESQMFHADTKAILQFLDVESSPTKPLCGYSGGFLLHCSTLAEPVLHELHRRLSSPLNHRRVLLDLRFSNSERH